MEESFRKSCRLFSEAMCYSHFGVFQSGTEIRTRVDPKTILDVHYCTRFGPAAAYLVLHINLKLSWRASLYLLSCKFCHVPLFLLLLLVLRQLFGRVYVSGKEKEIEQLVEVVSLSLNPAQLLGPSTSFFMSFGRNRPSGNWIWVVD